MSEDAQRSDLVDLHDLDWWGETEKAIAVTNLKGQKVWLPKSLVEYNRRRMLVDVTLPEWLATQRELI